MAKLLSAKEAKLQKKLIPLNIFVFILSLIAAFSLVFTPIIKIDIGKILSNPDLEKVVQDTLDDTVGNSIQGTSQEDVNYVPVLTTVVKSVLGDVKGSITISASDAGKVALSSAPNKGEVVMNNILFGEKGLVTELIDSTVRGLFNVFKTVEGKTLVEETVVAAITSAVVASLPNGAADAFTDEKITELATTFRKLNDVKTDEQAQAVIDEFVGGVGEVLGPQLNDEEKDKVSDYIFDMYKKAADEVDKKDDEEFSLEAMICVAVSSGVNLGGFNISDVFGGLVGGGNEENPEGAAGLKTVKALAEGEAVPEGGEEGGQDGEQEPPTGEDPADNPSTGETPAEPPTGENPADNPSTGETPSENPPAEETPDEDKVICTNYDDLLAQMGFNEDDSEEIIRKIRTSVEQLVKDKLGNSTKYFEYYGYLFYGMLVFVVPWLILALFAFIKIFTKNKRFMMWYVKLYSFIPGLISLALISAKLVINKNMFGLDEKLLALAKAGLSGVSSMTWISGACYLILWLVSICWAFPIKHKIRKERKACKQAKKDGTYDYNDFSDEMGYGVTDEENYDYGSDEGDGYEYSDDEFDDDLDSGSDYDYSYSDDD